uniref:Uncharacterized protein n=1 Tax=Aegilops tauschii subsp. strangulata TaxID=200361 RepID=A0A453R3C8_AEGTS
MRLCSAEEGTSPFSKEPHQSHHHLLCASSALCPEKFGRTAGHPGEGVRRRHAVQARPGPDPRVHLAGASAARGGGAGPWPAGLDRRRAVQGRPDDRPELMVLREHPGEVLAVGHGRRRGRERAPAQPRGAPAHRRGHARHEGAGRDVPAQHDRRGRHQRLVHVRLRRPRPRRPHPVDHVQAREPHHARPAVSPGRLHGAVLARASLLRLQGQARRRYRKACAACPALRRHELGAETCSPGRNST